MLSVDKLCLLKKEYASYSPVYLSPDRSPEQREARKELIASMKAKAFAEPDKKFYIKDGEIHCANLN